MDELATQRQLVKIQLQSATHGDALLNALTKVLKLSPLQRKDINTLIEEHIDANPVTEDKIDIFVPKL